MITICTRWEELQMSPYLEWRMWRQLRGAFGIDQFIFTPKAPEMANVNLIQCATMEEALERCPSRRVFLEPEGESDLETLTLLSSPFTLVLGNTEFGNMDLVQPERGDIAVKIKSPKPTDLYGINAAAIALAYWYGQ